METNQIISLGATAIEIGGLLLLTNEVSLGREMEEIAAGFERDKRLQFLYATKNYEAFMIQSRLDSGDTPEQARRWAEGLGSAAIQTAAETLWGAQAPILTQSINRYEKQSAPRAMRIRHRDFVVGTVLLLLAATVQGALALIFP